MDASVCVHYSIPPELLKAAQEKVRVYIEKKEADHNHPHRKSAERTPDPVSQETKLQMAIDNLSPAALENYKEHYRSAIPIQTKKSVPYFKQKMNEIEGKEDESLASSREKNLPKPI